MPLNMPVSKNYFEWVHFLIDKETVCGILVAGQEHEYRERTDDHSDI